MTLPDGTGGPPPADDPPTTRLKPIGPDTPPPGEASYGTYGGPAPGAYGTADGAGNGSGSAFGPPPQPGAGRARRRGLRTALLLVAAVLAGALGGVTYGYYEQAGEPPTPLPPLNQPGLAHPKKPLPADEAPEPLSAAQDRRVKTDGDLRELLVPIPDGATDAELDYGGEGWLAPYELAADTGAPEEMLGVMLEFGLRRTAFTSWTEDAGADTVVVYLSQFRDEDSVGSAEYMEMMETVSIFGIDGDVRTESLKGSSNGKAYFPAAPIEEAGLLPLYQGNVLARRGDIVLEIYMYDSAPIAEKDLTALAERQLERL
ncbi:hypothetical protein [Streptomyces sp. MAR4 CNX-425]|uniref:hypothetical protein n=1 Tax=Streptomyces sp. MAR4 CNX-425 TaxID=3406343 RepID=UPI003B503A41